VNDAEPKSITAKKPGSKKVESAIEDTLKPVDNCAQQ